MATMRRSGGRSERAGVHKLVNAKHWLETPHSQDLPSGCTFISPQTPDHGARARKLHAYPAAIRGLAGTLWCSLFAAKVVRILP